MISLENSLSFKKFFSVLKSDNLEFREKKILHQYIGKKQLYI